jgi:signal recognition particle subunit SRP54
MMFDQLTSAISQVAKSFGGGGSKKKRITEQSIQGALRDTRRALLDADVNVEVADTLIAGVRARSLGDTVLEGITAEQQFIKALYDELVDIFGGGTASSENKISVASSLPAATLAVGSRERPTVILLAGLQGAGKTTAAGKLALYLKEREVDYDQAAVLQQSGADATQLLPSRLPKRNRRVLLVAADIYRPAAIKQLQILGESIGVDVYTEGTDVDPVTIVTNGIARAIAEGMDTVIVDTAGRQVIDADLMDELKRMQQAAAPDETLLVVDAMTGQEAASLTAAFDAAIGITGAILTKMDGDSRGGAAVSVRGVSGKPIKFVGTGEKTADLEPFYPDRMASRILGMGDVVSLVEKAAAEVSDADASAMEQKIREARFDFDDFLKQTEMLSKMGSVAGLAKMMPGMSGQLSSQQIREVEARMKVNKSMICSMNKAERANPDLLIKDRTARSRLMRITKGSGRTLAEGTAFMSEFQRMKTLMSRMQKQMSGQDPSAAVDPSAIEDMAMPGNRAMRRAGKKNKKAGRGLGAGFG